LNLNISIGGRWDADKISMFQENLREFFMKNTEQFLDVLNSFADSYIRSFWHFFFDAPVLDHPFLFERIKRIYRKIKKLNNKRIIILMIEQYSADLIKYIKYSEIWYN